MPFFALSKMALMKSVRSFATAAKFLPRVCLGVRDRELEDEDERKERERERVEARVGGS